MSEKSPIVPILAGAGGAVVASLAAEKVGLSPTVAAWGTAAAGAATALGSTGITRQIATGVGAAGACLGAVSLFASMRAESAKKEIAQRQQETQKRQAEAASFVTRDELNAALSRAVDDANQKSSCALASALREEVKQAVFEASRQRPPHRAAYADDDDYTRNAYGEDDDYLRNTYGDEDDYLRNAYGEDDDVVRNAYGEEDDYLRNAYGDEDDARNALADEDEYVRNAYADESSEG